MTTIINKLKQQLAELEKTTLEFTEWYQYESMQVLDIELLANLQKNIKDNLESAKLIETTLSKWHDLVRKRLLPEKLQEKNINGISYAGIGKVSLIDDAYVSVKANKQQSAFEWLSDMGHGEIIKETVHAGALKALLKNKLKEGEEIPEDIFNVQEYKYSKIKREK
jgi:hypothetical protein